MFSGQRESDILKIKQAELQGIPMESLELFQPQITFENKLFSEIYDIAHHYRIPGFGCSFINPVILLKLFELYRLDDDQQILFLEKCAAVENIYFVENQRKEKFKKENNRKK